MDWYKVNLLYLNPSKTYCVRFHSRQKHCHYPDIAIDNVPITYRESVRFLGIEVDQNLNWGNHCTGIISQLSSSCYLFKSLRNLLTVEQLTMLYHARVGSRLRYAIILWGSSSHAGDVFLYQKRVVRSILGLKPTDSCRPAFKSLKILTLTSLYIYEVCSYVYAHKSSFSLSQDIHSLNTRNKSSFHVRFARLDTTRNMPHCMGLKIFNYLPEHLRNVASIGKFKGQLKTYLLDRSIYSLGEFCPRLVGG